MASFSSFIGLQSKDSDPNLSDNTLRVAGNIRFVLFASILFLIIFSAFFSFKKWGYILGILLITAGAAYIAGFLVGFLFGIPRSVQFRSGNSSNTEDTFFADNTNLEEISDWLTKIIIGLTLVEFQEIQRLLDNAAIHISEAFPKISLIPSMVVFSYALLIFYLGLGFFAGYFWTRTQFGSILVNERITQQKHIEERRKVDEANRGQSTANEEDLKAMVDGISLNELKKNVAALLVDTPIIHEDDTQKDRWGGQASLNNRILRASVIPSTKYSGYFDVTIEVAATSPESPLTQTVVVLIDKTFPESEIYLTPVDNKATVTIISYEAFTIAALCDNLETKLELDLQQQKGLPSAFYYKS